MANAMTKGNNMSEQRTIEVTLDGLKDKIATGALLEQLERSPAFKKLITVGYFESKAAGLVSMIGLPQSDAQAQMIHNGMIGISALQAHLRAIKTEASRAAESLAEYELALEEGEIEAGDTDA